ncbi:hypothetical protein [Sphingobium phenoxybenzoativorans]|uniref:hypothetical protein n=1 Tax=Sphingobium phenoxybenzoativorans TaxID=1592790 RepID=UPI000AEE6BEA|nr:hypothetical protein [Sphingobium phenoxybenzoativorans]
MQQNRKTLSIKMAKDQLPDLSPDDPANLIAQAIQVRVCLTAVYNKASFLMAPHILYTKHDDLFIDAMTVECDGKAPREPKLGTFKLSGLNDVAMTGQRFTPLEGFDPTDQKYSENTVRAIRL